MTLLMLLKRNNRVITLWKIGQIIFLKYDLLIIFHSMMNIKRVTLSQWQLVVKSDAFMQLTIQCANNRKTFHLKYVSFVRASYLKTELDLNIARVIFKARTGMFDIHVKVNYIQENINSILTALWVSSSTPLSHRAFMQSSNISKHFSMSTKFKPLTHILRVINKSSRAQ